MNHADLCSLVYLCTDITRPQISTTAIHLNYYCRFQRPQNMDLAFLRAYDTAKVLSTSVHTQTLPEIVFETLVRLLEITDSIKITRKNKFLTRTYYLQYLLANTHLHIPEDDLFKIGLSCLYLTLQMGGSSAEITSMLQFIVGSQYGSYYISQEHTHFLQGISSTTTVSTQMTTPYDFVVFAKEHVPLLSFQRLACFVIDLALTLPQSANVSAQQIFVACCMFICDRNYNQSIADLIDQKFQVSLGGGFEMKSLLNQAFQTIMNNQF